MQAEIIKEFQNRFYKEPGNLFFCPGRVNLIGEHIDYNGGNVMPCAISLGTWLAVSKNTDKKFRFQCLNFPETVELNLQSSYSKTGKEWFNYPLGIINSNKKRTLTDSKYNERFTECGAALKLLKQELKVQSLCDINMISFQSHRHLINDPVLEKRALHVISENERVREAAISLKAED